MTKRIDENLSLRKDKMALASLDGDGRDQAAANGRFFTSVEGLFALNEADAIEGLYITTEPYPRLARAHASPEASALRLARRPPCRILDVENGETTTAAERSRDLCVILFHATGFGFTAMFAWPHRYRASHVS